MVSGARKKNKDVADTPVLQEQLSALMDGELDTDEIDAVLKAMRQDASGVADWICWHRAKEAMQGQTSLQPTFMQQFSERLAAEPTILAPRRTIWRRMLVPMSVAASMSFVAVVGFQSLRTYESDQDEMSVEMVSNNDPAAVPLSTYLVAHNEEADAPLVLQTSVTTSIRPGHSR